MDEEKKPLLLRVSVGDNERNGEGSGGSSSETSLSLGSYRIPIYGTSKPPAKIILPEERITYTWNEINVFTNKNSASTRNKIWSSFIHRGKSTPTERKHILKTVTGVAYPGELLAIMGSSGAGKTTLLNTLTFRSPSTLTTTGIRCINGVPVSPKSLISQSAYVQQDDLFIGNLTVKEHLVFQALVKMDRNISYHRRMQRVEEVIQELSLSKCENTIIGVIGRTIGISGGERKRLSFASEVLTDPHLMFCDEPTSGLDSFMALNVVQVLKSLAHSGKTVVCTIHQPSSEIYALFDKLLLMSEGRTAFLGSPEEADEFFKSLEAPCPKNYNPADYFIQLLAIVPEKEESCRQAVALICDNFEKSEVGVKVVLEAVKYVEDSGQHSDIWLNGDTFQSPYKASWCAQFRAVLWRSWLSVIKEPLLVKVRLLQTTIVSLIIGSIYFGQRLDQDGVMNINGVLFIFLTNMTFQNVFAVVNVFCAELPIFLREHRNGMYRTDVYFLCKTMAEAPIFITIPILFISICYFMIGLNAEVTRFVIACGILVLISNVTISFGYLISCASSSVSMALSVGPPLIIPFLLFGGFFLNISSVPVYFKWLSYISWFRYGNEALMINQWKNVTNINCPVGNSTCPKDGRIILESYSFFEEDFVDDLLWLVALMIGFRLVAYFLLLLKTYKNE